MPKKQKVHFHYLIKGFGLPRRKKLKAFIEQLIKKEGRTIESINYIFCSDEYLLQLNMQYLNHNTYTDIISFELSTPETALLSDIYISIERVRENARLFKSPFYRELHRVIFHGSLHLCGYRDKTTAEATIIRKREDYYLNKYFVPRENQKIKS